MIKQSYKNAYGAHKEKGARFARKVHHKALSTPKKIAITVGVLMVVGVVAFQFFYPTDKVVPFAKVNGIAVGGMEKKEAVKVLDAAYAKAAVPIYFSSDSDVKVKPSYKELGVKIDNTERIAAHDYPWYVRIVPTSLLWYGFIDQSGEEKVSRDPQALDAYFAKHFGADCTLSPVNAGLEVKDGALRVVSAISGGVCDYDELHPALEKVAVSLSPKKIVVNGTTELPAVSDEIAEKEKTRIEGLINGGVAVQVGDKKEAVPKDALYEWLQYSVEEGALQVGLDAEKSTAWLNEKYGKQLAVAPGVTTVTTRDFTELSRSVGASGQALDTDATRAGLTEQLRGKGDVTVVAVKPVAPTVKYNRSYSPTDAGLSALMKNFAESHSGTYGVSMVELSGQKRRAEYNAGAQFTTASTYKLFVVYSALLRVENGSWKYSDQISGGRDLAQCIDDTIVKSDNPCAEAMLRKAGFSAVTNEAKAIGATNTSFMGSNGIKSTARDEAVFMGALYSGQLLSQQASRDRLINALKRNVYRKGVPAGVPGVAVANKVGFLDGLLHDAAIVYSPSGAYVLVILTDGSSWANIAELTKQIEALRNG